MSRLETMGDYLKPYIAKQVQIKIAEAKIMRGDDLISHVEILLQKALERQKQVSEWCPCRIALFHLLTSHLTKSYEYQIILTDSQMYLDEMQVWNYWKPEFLYNEKLMEIEVRTELQKRFVRLTDYEVSYAIRYLFYEYRTIIGVYWNTCIKEIINLPLFKELNKGNTFLFLFGDYMGEVQIAFTYKREDA